MNKHTIKRFQCSQCGGVFTERDADERKTSAEALHGVAGEFGSSTPITYYACPNCGCDELDDAPVVTADDLHLEHYHKMIASIPVDQAHYASFNVVQPEDAGLYVVADNIYEDVDDSAVYFSDELYTGIVERIIDIWHALRQKQIKQVRKDVLAHYQRMIDWAEAQPVDEKVSIYDMGVDLEETWLSDCCPLCDACRINCRRCPITHSTGNTSCEATPWHKMACAPNWGEWLSHARLLYNFLENLDYSTLGILYSE